LKATASRDTVNTHWIDVPNVMGSMPLSINNLNLITEPWVSVEDVAKHLGIAKDSVYRWIEQKGLPAHKIRRLWKFKLSEVDEWVQTGGVADKQADEHRDDKE
jgi:excisionase family DNA binding protein